MKRCWTRAGVLVASVVLLLALAPSAGAAVLLQDGFESGGLAAWSVLTGGNGAATVQSSIVRAGARAARLSATATPGSVSRIRWTLPASTTAILVEADFRVLADGGPGVDVPILKLHDRAGAPLVSVSRQHESGGKLSVAYGDSSVETSGRLAHGSWRRVGLRVAVAGASRTIELSVDGTNVYRTTVAGLGTGAVSAIGLGGDLGSQRFDIAVDNVEVHDDPAAPPPPPPPPPPPQDSSPPQATIDSGPTGRATTSATGPSCDPSLPAPTTTDPGTLALADGFESGFGQWTEVVQEGDATARIQNTNVKRGLCGVQLNVTNNIWSSRANLQKVLPERTNEIWASGWFNLLQEGSDPGWNLPTFRIFSGGKRVFDFSRQNVYGKPFIRWRNPAGGWSFGYPSPNMVMSLNRWYLVKIHVVANGDLSTAEVFLDGALVYRNTAMSLGASQFDAVILGAEHQNQVGVLAADDAVIKSTQAPVTPVVFSDGFESGNFANWTATQVGGDGTASVLSGVASAGTYAARLTASATSGSFAAVRKTLAAAQGDLTTEADVKVLSEGASGASAPLIAVNDAGNARLVTVVRQNHNGDRLAVQYGGSTFATSGTLPLGTYKTLALRTITFGAGAGTVALSVNGSEVYRSTTASIGSTGVKSLLLGNTSTSGAYSFYADRVSATKGTAGPQNDPRYKLLIADYLNKRLVITDFDGRVVWKMDNPAANPDPASGPIGVRWLPNNQILLTCGTGEVGVVNVATKTWLWKVKGFNGEAFKSPYDAELLPDGNLAVATRFNSNGRVTVYNRSTGAEVWRHLVPQAHSVHYRTADQSYNSSLPTLLVGGFGDIKEVTYQPNVTPTVAWRVPSEYTHDAVVVENDRVITTEGYYVQKIDRAGTRLWKMNTPDEDRRFAVNPNFGGGYVFTVGEGDRIEFRDVNGNLLRDFARLSDSTVVDYPYGIQVIEYPG